MKLTAWIHLTDAEADKLGISVAKLQLFRAYLNRR